jgi:hypothetical protein
MMWVASCSTGAGSGGGGSAGVGGGNPSAGPTADGGGSAGFTLAGRQFAVPLGDVGLVELLGDDAPAKTAAAIEIFSQVPTDAPDSCVLSVETRNCTLTDIATAQSIRVIVQIDAATSTTPCDTGVEVGTFALTHDGQSWSTESAAIDLSGTALAHVRSGQFTLCLSAYGGAGGTLHIGEMTVAFTAGAAPPPAGNDDDDVDEALVTEMIAFQDSLDSYFEELESLAESVGDESAKEQMAATIAEDPSVAWTEVTPQGVLVQYANGGSGILVLDALNGAGEGGDDIPASAVSFRAAQSTTDDVKPVVAKVLYIQAAYDELKGNQDWVFREWQESFARIGEVTVDKYLNDQCTIDRYFALNGYDFVYFGGHGWQREHKKTGAQEVYLLTGELSDESFMRRYSKEWAVGQWVFGSYTPRRGVNEGKRTWRAWIGPGWLAAGLKTSAKASPQPLDLWGEGPLVWGGFCFSYLGSWQAVTVDGAGASGYLGYDWSVLAYDDSTYAIDLVRNMCDTTLIGPMEIGFWLDNTDLSEDDLEINDPDDPTEDVWRTVTLQYHGTPNVIFWEREESDEPAADCTIIDPELGSKRWHVRWQWDCDGVMSNDNRWHFHEDGTISDHWLGLIEDYQWRVEGDKVIITTNGPGEELIFTWEATLSDDCSRMENGQTIYHDGSDGQGSCWEATPG